jgi:uncharacterized protein
MITPAYAAILAILFFYLSIRVIGQRRKSQTGLGIGSDVNLERVIRVHANFAEYVPFALLLIFFVEQAGHSQWLIHILGSLLTVGRVIHAYGVSQSVENFKFRVTGMAITFTVLLTCASILIYSTAIVSGS